MNSGITLFAQIFGETAWSLTLEVGAEHANAIVGALLGAYPTRFAVVQSSTSAVPVFAETRL